MWTYIPLCMIYFLTVSFPADKLVPGLTNYKKFKNLQLFKKIWKFSINQVFEVSLVFNYFYLWRFVDCKIQFLYRTPIIYQSYYILNDALAPIRVSLLIFHPHTMLKYKIRKRQYSSLWYKFTLFSIIQKTSIFFSLPLSNDQSFY